MNMTGFKKRQGFTLIEIIIVVVILGILAAVALPKLTENIGKATAAEAFQVGGAVGKAYDRCLADQSGGVAVTNAMALNCNTFALLNMQTPPDTNFTYALSGPGAGVTLVLTATAQAKNGLTGDDIIKFSYAGDTGVVTKTCAAGSHIANMCK